MGDPPAMLRLELAAGDLRRARRHPRLADAAGKSRTRTSRLALTLQDTGSRSFAAAGWLCAATTDTGTVRQETVPVAGLPLKDAPALDGMMDILASGEAEVSHRSLPGDVEVQFLHQHLSAGDRDADAAEILLTGPVSGTVPLALELAADLPLAWSGVAPVVAMAAELAVVEPPPVRAASIPFDLADDADAVTAFATIVRHCLMQFDANMQPVLRNRDIESVHQMRVALRRLRSALSLFRAILPPDLVAPLIEELRWLNGPLGRKRDIDVFLSETLVPLTARLPDPKGLRHLATVLEDRRDAAQTALDAALRSPRCLRLRLGLEDMLLRLPAAIAASDDAALREAACLPAHRYAALLLRRRARKVGKLGRRHDELDTAALHRLRIQAKKLRYAVEFFRPLFGRKPVRRFHGALAQLQDCLGALNDAAVGDALMRDVLAAPAGDPASAAIAGWFIGRQEMQLAHLGDAWRAYAKAPLFWKDALPG